MDLIKGKVWKLGDNISTDLLMPSECIFGKVPEEEVKNYCMSAERPDFAKNVKKGDIVVSGKNFGCGSSRPAGKILMDLGISCVLAETVAGIFFRNSINMGLPILTIKGISEFFREGDEAEINLSTGEIKNLVTNKIIRAHPIPEELMKILKSGGILSSLKEEAKVGRLYENLKP